MRRLPVKDRYRHPQSDIGVVTMSIGVACLIPATQSTPEQLIDIADQALYAVKGAGRNREAA